MEQLEKLLKEEFLEERIIYIVLSNRRKKDENTFNKVNIKPVMIKEDLKSFIKRNLRTVHQPALPPRTPSIRISRVRVAPARP